MLGCRPDYLLYPEYNTQLERAEHVRFFNNNGVLLPVYQDYTNSFKKKKVVVTDKYMWIADNLSILEALKRLEETNNLYFLKQINLKKLIDDEKTKQSIKDAREVCNILGIEHYVVDLQKEFKDIVINNFLGSYQEGITPNPCVAI